MKKSITRKIIAKSSLELYAPHGIVDELNNAKPEILKRSNKTEHQFDQLKSDFLRLIQLIDHSIIKSCENSAKNLIGDKDPKDIIYVATLLCTNAVGIWTNDQDFDIPQIRIYHTHDIIRYFGLYIK